MITQVKHEVSVSAKGPSPKLRIKVKGEGHSLLSSCPPLSVCLFGVFAAFFFPCFWLILPTQVPFHSELSALTHVYSVRAYLLDKHTHKTPTRQRDDFRGVDFAVFVFTSLCVDMATPLFSLLEFLI